MIIYHPAPIKGTRNSYWWELHFEREDVGLQSWLEHLSIFNGKYMFKSFIFCQAAASGWWTKQLPQIKRSPESTYSIKSQVVFFPKISWLRKGTRNQSKLKIFRWNAGSVCIEVGVSKNRGTPKWMVKIMENPIKMDDWGYHYFRKHPSLKVESCNFQLLMWMWMCLAAAGLWAAEFFSFKAAHFQNIYTVYIYIYIICIHSTNTVSSKTT